MSKIEKLTKAQEKLLPKFHEKWLKIGLSTEPADKPRAEAAITEMYSILGKPRPQFVWAASPMTAELLINILSDEKLGQKVTDSLWDSLESSLGTSLESSLESSLRSSLRSSLESSLRSSLESSLRSSLRSSLGGSLWASLGGSLRSSLRSSLGGSLRSSLESSQLKYNGTWFWGSQDSYWIAFYLFCEKIGVKYKAEDSRRLKLWADIAQSCSWWYPFENTVIVADRPCEIHMDGTRLHRDGGMAVKFRDGWGIYRLNGVAVSQEIAETPAKDLDPKIITTEKNAQVRAEIVKKIGITRIAEALNAQCIDKLDGVIGGPYELLLLDLGDGRKREYLKMINPSVPSLTHIEGVRPGIKTVREALEWRNKTAELPAQIS